MMDWDADAQGDLVQVDYRKYDGRPHRRYPAVRLGADEHGVWLGVPGGEFIEATQSSGFKYDDPYVLLVPDHAWWTAMFNSTPRRTEIYCDIATPAIWAENEVHLIDLDLDVRRRRGTTEVELLDEDEFAEHSEAFGYPTEVISQAWAAAHFLLAAIRDGQEPFAGGYHRWLDQVTDPGATTRSPAP
jgi:protein associated with RNAse G/E